MISRFSRFIAIAAAAAFVVGCAGVPQVPISMSRDVGSSQGSKVGIMMTELPKVSMEVPGAACLLCVIFAKAANSTVTKYAETLPLEDLPAIPEEIAKTLRKQGATVVIISEKLKMDSLPDAKNKETNFAKKDFSQLIAKHGVDRLVVVDFQQIGLVRPYAGYIPTSDPKAQVLGEGYVVNGKTNGYEWYLPIQVLKGTEQKWDEPPKFPGLTNAYFQALELARDAILKAFSEPPKVAPAVAPAATVVASPPAVVPAPAK
jgi:hypothetical protein